MLNESSAQKPINAYGKSKRAIEEMLVDYEAAHGMKHVIFRYFNVAGADPDSDIFCGDLTALSRARFGRAPAT